MNGEQAKKIYESLDAVMAALPADMRDEASILMRTLQLPEAQDVLREWLRTNGYIR